VRLLFLTTWVFLLQLSVHLLKIFIVVFKMIVILFEFRVFIIDSGALLLKMSFFLLHLDVEFYRYKIRLRGLSSIHYLRISLKRWWLSLSWCLAFASSLLWQLPAIDIEFWRHNFGLSRAYYTCSAEIGWKRSAKNRFVNMLRWTLPLSEPSVDGWLWEIVSEHWKTRREEISKNLNSNIILKLFIFDNSTRESFYF
jgi:hypothetical protein